MEDVKKSLLRYNDNDLGVVQAIVRASEASARNCGFMNDPGKFNDFVLKQLTATNDFMYILGQQGNVEKQDLITNDDPSTFPKFRWGKNILALDAHPVAKIKQIRSVVRRIAEYMEVEPTPPYLFLQDVEAVVDVINTHWRLAPGWKDAFVSMLKFLEVIGSPLKSQYEEMFTTERVHATITPDPKPTLSVDDIGIVRAAIDKLTDRAMEMLDHPQIAEYDPFLPGKNQRMQVVQDALVAQYLFGSDENHEPIRRDLVTIVFDSPQVDKNVMNYCKITDDEVWLILNYQNKVNPKSKTADLKAPRKQALKIAVHEKSPKFASLLRKLCPVGQQIMGPVAHLFFGYQQKKDWRHAPYGGNVLSCRSRSIFKRLVECGDLPERLEKLANGVNKARHASITEDRANEDNLSEEEIADQHHRRGQRPPIQPASENYGHNAQENDDDAEECSAKDNNQVIELGSRVTLTDLASPRGSKLNSVQGIVIDFDVNEHRYRVNLDTGHSGLFKRENLLTNSVPAFSDLQGVDVGEQAAKRRRVDDEETGCI
eukprot:COSAG02_NODE_2617_length_8409_cov_2.491697_5_plen_542_part_00